MPESSSNTRLSDEQMARVDALVVARHLFTSRSLVNNNGISSRSVGELITLADYILEGSWASEDDGDDKDPAISEPEKQEKLVRVQ
jgi:hypothetical protein